MNDNSPGISNLREPRFALSTRMIGAMLGIEDPAPRLVALINTPLQNPRMVSEAAMAAVAESIVNSEDVIGTFAACEWDCLSSDGQQWVIAIVRETLRRAAALIPVEGDAA